MGDGSSRIYNLISLVFFVLTIGVLAFGVTRFMQGAPQTPVAAIPTAMELPTVTPTFTPSKTLPATWTPTPTWTDTPTNTPTDAPTLTPSRTVTATPAPTDTPTNTPTPSDTPTVTPTPTLDATATPVWTDTPQPSPFPFALRNNQVAFTSNFANTAACQWQGFGGAVFDLGGRPFNGVRVHVYDGQTVDLYTASGSNTLYGQGGWEIQVATGINDRTYFVELQSAEGTVISPTVQVTFPGSCDGNLAVVTFEQTRPF